MRGNRIRNAAFTAVRGNAASNLQIVGNTCSGLGEVALYAEFGFEGAVIPMAEAKDPRHDAPFALFTGLVTTTILYCLIQYVVVATLPAAAATDRPLAMAASVMWGNLGAAMASGRSVAAAAGSVATTTY